ncbi:hypothetical protein [Intestinibacter sp.]
MKNNSKFKQILILIGIIVLFIYGFKKIVTLGINWVQKGDIKINYEHEWDNMSDEDKKIVKSVISLAEERVGNQCVWGGTKKEQLIE